MKTVISGFLLFLGLICSSISGFAQQGKTLLDINDLSNIKIDSYSDADIRSFYDKAAAAGLSQDEMLKMAYDKGLPNEEITKLRSRLSMMSKSTQGVNSPSSDDRKYQREQDTTGSSIPMETFKPDETIFGSEFFTKNSLVFEPNLHMSAPAGYILGPDDEITVNVYGFSEKSYSLRVNEEGYIYIQNVGPIYVSGLSLEQANEKIKSKLGSTIYRAIKTGQTKVQISLSKIRSIRVSVIGQAKKPGTFTVSSLTTLYNVLYLCGGPTSKGSYRAIELIRGTQKRSVDLYAFLVRGDQRDNVLLEEGDVIRIPYYKNRVGIKGNVKREGKFEMLENETFSDLLDYCGGFDDTAYRASVSVTRITLTQKKMIDLNVDKYNTFKVNGSDEYFVSKLIDRFENKVILSGAVSRPGNYELTDGLSLKALIDRAGGLLPDAFTKQVTIFRYYKNKLPTTTSVNLDSVFQYNKDVLLLTDDSIAIHSIFDFKDQYTVKIEGNVRKPGNMAWRENLSVRDLVLASGGLTDGGDSATVEVSRRIKNADVSQANHLQTQVFNINLSNENQVLYLEPFDLVVVKALPGYSMQRTVLVVGEVKSPGRYALEKSGDRISDLFTRIGGFKASADTNSVTIRRVVRSNMSIAEREKLFQKILNVNKDSLNTNDRLKNDLYKTYDIISVNLKEALSHPGSSENLILEDGDVLTVDRTNDLVKISGEVFYPTLLPYKANTSAKYYIRQAGNFTNSARKTGVTVIYPNGKARSVKRFLFLKFYPTVYPRSEIFVPQRLLNNKSKLSVAELTLIVSALGIIANVIILSHK